MDDSFHPIEDLGLVKKLSQWVPKLVTTAQKQEQDNCSDDFPKLIWRHFAAFLASIVKMDKSAVSFHIFETKQRVPVVGEKRPARPKKSQKHATRD
jgi:hypothetical protein